jgi:hypothetical protein
LAVDEIAGAVGWKREERREMLRQAQQPEKRREMLRQAQQPEKGRIENKKNRELSVKNTRFTV